jgi:hypothetical protein
LLIALLRNATFGPYVGYEEFFQHLVLGIDVETRIRFSCRLGVNAFEGRHIYCQRPSPNPFVKSLVLTLPTALGTLLSMLKVGISMDIDILVLPILDLLSL